MFSQAIQVLCRSNAFCAHRCDLLAARRRANDVPLTATLHGRTGFQEEAIRTEARGLLARDACLSKTSGYAPGVLRFRATQCRIIPSSLYTILLKFV